MDKSVYQQFSINKLGITFNDIDKLIIAFTHRSYLNEHKKLNLEHNERYEFLGDAVLELVVTEYLFLNFQQPEGILTNWRSSLVRTESIGAVAARYDFLDMMRLSKGEKRGTERAKEQILANCYEAVVGAIYLDLGFSAAAKFITESLITTLKGILETGSWMDSKSQLQELAQAQDESTPIYRVIDEIGPDHDKLFTVGVYVKDRLMGQGEGPSKQIAQQKAASAALNKYKTIKS